MKHRKLLILIPAIMALSSCGYSPKANAEIKTNPTVPDNSFLEDTKAHDELFSGVSELKVRKTFTPVESAVPAIGIQTNIDNHGTVDESDDTVSVRFVAAVAIDGELGSATAVWTRAMFEPNGNAFKTTASMACTTAYTALATAGSPYTIDDYNNASGGSYTHFVAYTMRNIPLSDYADYYFTAYLTLNDGSGETVSKVAATTVDLSTQFSFRVDDTGYFAIKRNNSGFEAIAKDEFDDGGAYHAQFEGISFTNTDSFVVVNRSLNHFQVFGYDAAHTADPSDTYFTQLNSSQFLHSRYERRYFIFLNEDDRLSMAEAYTKTFYFKPNANWIDVDSRYAITLKFEDESNKRVYEMSKVGETNTYECDVYYIDSMSSAPIAFYKLPSGDSLDLTDKPHTQNLGWPLNNDDMFTMNKSNNNGYWSLRTEPNIVAETGNFVITDFIESVEIHTERQKEFLSYNDDYSTMPSNEYPDGNVSISESLPVDIDFDFNVPNDKVIDHYSVVFGKEADLSDGYEKAGDADTAISFYNPYLGKNYYKLVAHFTDSTFEESAIHNFYVDATCPRNLTIPGMTNCRDMGGRVLEDGGTFKQGLIYRTSGSGQGGWNAEAAYEEMVRHLGLRNEIYVADRGTSYTCSLAGVPVQNFYMDYQANGFNSNFSRNTEPLKKFFNFLADPNNYPVFFHCRIGTDRTGVCAIMLNGLLGVPLNEIYQDYLFSNFGNIGNKRYIGESAGNDNILRYMDYLQNFSGETFKNKVYNALLSIGVSRSTLNAVINNLTDGPRAAGNDAGQVVAFGNQLDSQGVVMSTYDNRDYSEHPTEYYTLTGPSQSVSYTFNAPAAYQGQIVAYIANGDPSQSLKLDYSLGLSLDGEGLTIRDATFYDAGMGQITKSGNNRWMYYPVILGIADISSGAHTIEINGRSGTMNIGGLTILNASTAVDLGGGGLSGQDPKHVHDYYYNYQVTTYATCEHAGEARYECSCGDYYIETLPKLSHEWDGPIVNNSAGFDGVNNYVATSGYNCSLCNKGALRWSAMDYDNSSSQIENNGSYIRMNSSQQANAGNDGVEGGGHLIYYINAPEALQHAVLSFDITPSANNVAIFDAVANDSAAGKDFVNGVVVDATKRYALYINDVRIELGADPGASTARGWYDWPVDFSLNAGVNKIEIVSMGGYRARMYNFQLTGFDAFVNNHEHELGSWQYDNNYHWKECVADGCSYEEHHHFDEDYHSFGDIQTVDEPTCTASGTGTRTCIVCGYTENVYLSPLGHDWVNGEITEQPTCLHEGTRTVTCSRCHAEDTASVPKIDHSWSDEVTVPAGDVDQVPYYTSTCSVGHENRIRISATDGTFAQGSSNKSGTPAGYIKLNSNGNSISYTFNYSGAATTAKIYQRAIFDSWQSTSNPTSSYSTHGTGEQGCNFEFKFNGDYVVISQETKTTQYQTMLNGGIDTGLGTSFSYMADCYIGEVQLNNGVNTFYYKRLASMNLLVHDYIIVIE